MKVKLNVLPVILDHIARSPVVLSAPRALPVLLRRSPILSNVFLVLLVVRLVRMLCHALSVLLVRMLLLDLKHVKIARLVL
jgi:hypothetical protein